MGKLEARMLCCAVAAAIAAAQIGCGDDADDDSGDVEFEYWNGGCSGYKGGHPIVLTPVDPEQYRGLTCVSWEVETPGELQLDLLRTVDRCMVDFSADVSIPDPRTVIVALETEGYDADCYCCYDHSITVYGVDTSGTVRVTFGPSLVIPLDDAPAGIRCRWEDPSGPAGAMDCSYGDYHRPCGPSQRYETCPEGQACVELDSTQQIGTCKVECEADEDCPLALLSCQQGLCEITAPLP